MLTPLLCRLGRTALGWQTRQLAEEAGVAASTISRFELGKVLPNQATQAVLRRAMEDAGVEFTDAGDTVGVRLRLLAGSHYDPNVGGHAPGDLRDAFTEAVGAFDDWKDDAPEPTVELRGQLHPISAVFHILRNCTDILPGDVADAVGDLTGAKFRRTYAAAARRLKGMIAKRAAPSGSSR